jgi:hypothetical protein
VPHNLRDDNRRGGTVVRWLHLCGLVLGIAAGARSAPSFAVEPTDGPGCLGVTVEECVRWLGATMTVDQNFLAASMGHRQDTDVNGKPIGGGLVTVYAKLPGELDSFVLLIHLRPNDTVERVESNLLRDLLTARSEQFYDQSKLYDIVWRLVGRRCPGIRKLELYRFFENSVKPRVTRQQEDLSTGLNGLHRIVSHAAGVPYCGGISLAYTHLIEWRGSTDAEAAAKRTQFSSIELQ